MHSCIVVNLERASLISIFCTVQMLYDNLLNSMDRLLAPLVLDFN